MLVSGQDGLRGTINPISSLRLLDRIKIRRINQKVRIVRFVQDDISEVVLKEWHRDDLVLAPAIEELFDALALSVSTVRVHTTFPHRIYLSLNDATAGTRAKDSITNSE